MPRRPRFSTGGYLFHVLNRAAGRKQIFDTDGDYQALQKILTEAAQRVPMRLLAYCVMPNHFHLLLWPRGDDDLSEYMRWLTMTHTARWHLAHDTVGTGALYQGRFKSFPIESDEHFYRVCRYVERNPLRANLVAQAENWRWSSLWQYTRQVAEVPLHAWPLPRPTDWVNHVNSVETEAELQAVRTSVLKGTPFGNQVWRHQTAIQLGLEQTLPRGERPRSGT